MTAGIQGTGPYSSLKYLRYLTKKNKYEIDMLSPGPRKLRWLLAEQTRLKAEISALHASIRQAKLAVG